jgi:hydrogenase-4 component F
VKNALPVILIALPFASAAALVVVGSWRIGTWINAGSASLLFLLACLLPWHLRPELSLLHVGETEAHLVLLTGFVAMTTAWFSRSYTQAALVARSFDRRRSRLHHVGCQALIGAILLALLSDTPVLTWLALTIAVAAATVVTGVVRSPAATAAGSRLLVLCGVGLMLALLGTLLLYLAVEPHAATLRWSTLHALPHHAATLRLASFFLVIGYGALAGMAPLHSWLMEASAEAAAPGAILVSTLMVNAPLLILMRLRFAVDLSPLLIALGLVTLLLGAGCLVAPANTRRTVASAGMAQIGIIVFGLGVGGPVATFAVSLHMTLLALARAAVLQCHGLPPTHSSARTCMAGVIALALLPLFALFLLAGVTLDQSVWLMLPLAAGVLLTSLSLFVWLPKLTPPTIASRGAPTAPTAMTVGAAVGMTPIWLQLALVLLLALAMPNPVADWFTAVAAAR